MTKEQIGAWLPSAILALAAGCAWAVGRLTRGKVGQKQLYGTGGWLGLFLFCSFVLWPPVSIGTLFRSFAAVEAATPAVLDALGYVPYKAFFWCLLLGLIAWQIWIAHRLLTRFEPDSVAHAKQFLVISPFAVYLGGAGAAWTFLGVTGTGKDFAQAAPAFLSNLLWYMYFTRSERVRNTYGDRRPGKYPDPFETLRRRAGRTAALKHRQDPVFDEAPMASSAVSLQQNTELAPGWTAAPIDGKRGYAGHAGSRECTAGAPLWVVAILLAVLLVWCALAFHLPEKPSMAYALSVGMGALLLPLGAVATFSLGSNYPSERMNIKFFILCCTALLVISAVSTFVTRGKAERRLREQPIVAGHNVAKYAERN